MNGKIQTCFIQLSALILFVIAAIRLFGAVGATTVWAHPDSHLLLSNRHSLCLACGCEFALSAYLLMGQNRMVKLSLIALLAAFSMICQLVLWCMGLLDFYSCLGDLTDKFSLPPRFTYFAVLMIWCGLLLASCIFIAMDWGARRTARS
jgi:hypothetical protein